MPAPAWRRLALGIALPALLLASVPAGAQYRWVDEKGRVQYSDTPPPSSAKAAQSRRLGSAAPSGSAATPADGGSAAEAAKRAPVVLYTSPNCANPCRDARQLLNNRGIPFSEVIAFDPPQLEQLKSATGDTRIPSLTVGSDARVGFSAGSWMAALDKAGYPAQRAAGAPARNLPPIKLYTNSGCGALCGEARAFLAARQAPYTEVAVEDQAGVEELRKLTGQLNVPALVVGGMVQRGFDPMLYGRALESGGYPAP